jgi:hypothetical protein
MKALIFTSTVSKWTVSLRETKVAKGSDEYRYAQSGDYFERVLPLVQKATNWPWDLANNVMRWRARQGFVVAGVLARR